MAITEGHTRGIPEGHNRRPCPTRRPYQKVKTEVTETPFMAPPSWNPPFMAPFAKDGTPVNRMNTDRCKNIPLPHLSHCEAAVCTTNLSLEPHQCLFTSMWICCSQVMKYESRGIHTGFETQGRCHQQSKNRGISGPTKKDYPPKF